MNYHNKYHCFVLENNYVVFNSKKINQSINQSIGFRRYEQSNKQGGYAMDNIKYLSTIDVDRLPNLIRPMQIHVIQPFSPTPLQYFWQIEIQVHHVHMLSFFL